MTRTTVAVFAILCAMAAPARAGAYVRLSEIADRYGLTVDVDLLTGRYVLTDAQNRVALVPGGYQVLVNGRFFELGERIGLDHGDPIVPARALAGLDSTLARRPVVTSVPASVRPARAPTPPAEAKPRVAPVRAGTVVIDPGHGGPHTGTHGRTLVEKEVTLGVALIVRRLLEDRGYRVLMTRSDDRVFSNELNADLNGRVAFTNRSGADLFVSIHANYTTDHDVHGFEIWYARGRARSAALAHSVERALRAAVDDEDRGCKTEKHLRVTEGASIPAVLVEMGFLSHAPSERRLSTVEYRRKIAEAIALGIDRYRGAR